MIKPEDLRQATEYTLQGLTADESLKFRILQKATASHAVGKRPAFHPVPVLFSIFALLLFAVLGLNTVRPVSSDDPIVLNSFSAGNVDSVDSVPSLFLTGFDPESVVLMEIKGTGSVTAPESCSSLIRILENCAISDYSIDAASSSGTLRITDSSGNTVFFGTAEPYLIDENNRSLYCPDFFAEFVRIAD